ncbi:ABC transporter permease subunit [soil metagenome]
MLRIAGQVAVVSLVVLAGLWVWGNMTTGMAAARMTFSLDFLRLTAGFPIAEGPITYSPTDTYGHAYLVGLTNTLMVSILGIVLSTLLGVVVGVARLSTNWLVNRVAAVFVELMRNTPLLVQLVFIYILLLQLPGVRDAIALPGPTYLSQRGLFLPRPLTEPGFGPWLGLAVAGIVVALVAARWAAGREAAGQPTYRARLVGVLAMLGIPILSWVALTPMTFELPEQGRFNFSGGASFSPEFTALLVGLTIYTAAFIGETVRGGIQAIGRGQVEAAHSIGLTPTQTLRLIVFPQALRIIIPPLTSQYLNLLKNSSLAVAIGYPELFNVSRTMANQTANPVAVLFLVMGTYLCFSLVTSALMNIYNHRVRIVER